MSNRLSVAAQKAIDLWRNNPSITVARASELAGIAHTTLYRCIRRLKLKRKK